MRRAKQYGYDVFPTAADKKWFGKQRWTHEDIHKFMQQGRKRLLNDDDELRYDSLIVVICGHGGDGVIVPSECHKDEKDKTVRISMLHAKVGRVWNFKAAEIPRLFIVDCCRGNQFTGVVNRGAATVGHSNDLLFTLYGNSPGIQVEEDSKGGMFSQCLISVFADNIAKRDNLLNVVIAARPKLKEMSGHEQLLNVDGDPVVQTTVFATTGTVGRGKITEHACKLEEKVNDKKLIIRLNAQFDMFFSAEAGDGQDFVIEEMQSDGLGDDLQALGIAARWKVTACNGKEMEADAAAQIRAAFDAVNGYTLTFEQ